MLACNPGSSSDENGRELQQVDEPAFHSPTTIIFEFEGYPEPKCLSPDDLEALYQRFKTNKAVANILALPLTLSAPTENQIIIK